MKITQLEGTYHQLVRSLRKTDLLILDDWLRDTLSLVEAQYLLDILDDRYNRMATMLDSQFPISAWHAHFPDPTLADAILDRLVYNAIVLNCKVNLSEKTVNSSPCRLIDVQYVDQVCSSDMVVDFFRNHWSVSPECAIW